MVVKGVADMAGRFVLLVHLVEERHFLLAGTAPGRPEIHHDHLALVLTERTGLPAQSVQRKGGGRPRRIAAGGERRRGR